MRAVRCLTLAFGAAALMGDVEAATPLGKVLELLKKVQAEGKTDMHNEQVEFSKTQQWCEDTNRETAKTIAQETAQIEQLNADIADAAANSAQLAEEIGVLQNKLAEQDADRQAAAAVRKKENQDYQDALRDREESIEAIDRAIKVLKARSKDVPQSLAQLKQSKHIPEQAKAVIESFLSLGQTPEANAYEWQSGSVVEMLEGLKVKFRSEQNAADKEELNAKHSYQRLAQGLQDQTDNDNAAVATKSEAKAGRDQDHATATGDLASTETAKAKDEESLATTTADCATKQDEYTRNQKTRADELTAIAGAIEILEGEDVTGNADKHLAKDLAAGVAALAQLRGDSSSADSPARRHAIDFLQGRARELGSNYLALIAARAAADPFVKVKKMIQEMIWRLQDQANAEADQYGHCQSELAQNKQTREDKTAEIEKLSAEIEELTADIARETSEITELSDSVATIKKQQAEATQQRTEEKTTNTQTVADAKEGQAGVARAVEVLQSFYGASKAEAASYKGRSSEGGGIISMLEVVASDFSRLEAETSDNEASAQSSYEKMMNELNENVAVKEAEIEHKSNSKSRAEARNKDAGKERQLTSNELATAEKYYEELKPNCYGKKLSYSDRKQAREQEIQSLRDALKILEE